MKTKRRKLGALLGIIFVLLTCACASGTNGKNQSQESSGSGIQVNAEESKKQKRAEDPAGKSDSPLSGQMEVHFIDVGQADSILVKMPGAAMLVDAGKNEDGELVASYLREQGITRLDYVIGTHPHEDHIGGMDYVIQNFEIGDVILPGKTHTSKTYMDVLQAIQDKGLSITQAFAGQQFSLGEASFTVLSPKEDADFGDELNNWSVAIRLVYGDNSFVMTGDAEGEAEKEILSTGLELKADVWKAGHHGSETSNTDEILQAVQPEYAVISCGKSNQYGHPDESTLEKFKEADIAFFRTDEQGTIIAKCDGNTITWSTQPTTSMKAGAKTSKEKDEDTQPENQAEDPAKPTKDDEEGSQDNEPENTGAVLVHITETGTKYHQAGCQYLKDSDIEVTLEDAKDRGLEPCGKCKPPQ